MSSAFAPPSPTRVLPPAVRRYLRSPSTLLGFGAGFMMYASYAYLHDSWANFGLIFVGIFVAFALPSYGKYSNKVDEKIAFRSASVTAGRLGRFAAQFVMNLFLFTVLVQTAAIPVSGIAAMGGIVGIALVTTVMSQGTQYVAVMLSNRDIGNRNRNVLIAIALNIALTSIATLGLTAPQTAAKVIGLASGLLFFGMGVASDIRAKLYPKRGIGVFFGTFNPFHRTHIEILRKAIEERGLDHIYVHPTCVPKLHAEALEKGEIVIADRIEGRRVYETTSKADVIIDYFPTGREFYEQETRELIARLSLEEAGLSGKVTVLSFPEVYERSGFYGVISKIRELHRGTPIHGLHGSDLGGMTVRAIYDESGWIYPYAVRRVDGVSATAIRKGAAGMTAAGPDAVLRHLRNGSSEFEFDGTKYLVNDGVVTQGRVSAHV